MPEKESSAGSSQASSTAENPSSGAGSAPVDLAAEVARLQAELAEARDRALRQQAELENFRKRVRREQEEDRRYAQVPLLRDLLPVLDNVSRAIEAGDKTPDAAALLSGFKLIKQQLQGVLQQHHCQEIKALGEPFDPNMHAALCGQATAEHPQNTILSVAIPGFQVHDRVIRPSQVVIATPPA